LTDQAADRKEEIRKALYENWGVTKEMLVAFCDAVFSIAITLLIITIALPVIQDSTFDERFLQEMGLLLPKVQGFVISFFVIASFWMSLHRILFFVKKVDKRLIWLTMIFLFFIIFIPFPTSILGSYGNHAGPAIFYALIMSMTSFVLFLLWRYMTKGHRLVEADLDDDTIRFISKRALGSCALFLASMPVALISPSLAEICWAIFLIVLVIYKGR
jgi:uncharacterized membrane protein